MIEREFRLPRSAKQNKSEHLRLSMMHWTLHRALFRDPISHGTALTAHEDQMVFT